MNYAFDFLVGLYMFGYGWYITWVMMAQNRMKKAGYRNTEHFIGVVITSVFYPILAIINLWDGKLQGNSSSSKK